MQRCLCIEVLDSSHTYTRNLCAGELGRGLIMQGMGGEIPNLREGLIGRHTKIEYAESKEAM